MRSILLIFFLASSCLTSASGETWCDEEIARERAEDWKLHACRACKPLTIVPAGNCPTSGYDCDPALRTTSNVLGAGCACAHIRCADANATLAVNGQLVGKVHCADLKWESTSTEAKSGICARKCDVGVCPLLPDQFFVDHPTARPFVVQTPNPTHPCAWGTCADDGFGVNDDDGADAAVAYAGLTLFACTGDGTWRGPDQRRFRHVYCSQPPPVCGKLDPLWAKSACESVSPGAFTCVDPAEHSATRFECPPQHTIIVKTSPTNDYEELKSLTCDPNSREWMFEFGTKKLTKTEFMKLPNKGGPLEYKCYIPN